MHVGLVAVAGTPLQWGNFGAWDKFFGIAPMHDIHFSMKLEMTSLCHGDALRFTQNSVG